MSGGTLTVRGVTAGFEMPDGAMALTLGDITFAEQGDGTVRVTMAEAIPLVIGIETEDGDEGTIGMTIRQPGASMVVSGSTAG